MKALLQLLVLLFCLGRITASIQAQAPGQVIIANGGVFGPGNLVRMATFNPSTRQYAVFDSFPASSVQHVMVHGRDAFVCADSLIVKYDLDHLQRTAMTMVKGVRQSAAYQDKLLVSKGYGAVGEYMEVRNLSDLSLVHAVTGLSGECEGIVVHGDSAYVAVPIGFGAPNGSIGVVSLQSHLLAREIDLDTNGRIIKNLYLKGATLYSVNQISYSAAYGIVTAYNTMSGALSHHRVDLPSSQGCGIFNGKLYAAFGSGIGGWDLSTMQLVDSTVVQGFWAGMALDTVLQRFYVTETDYATYGRMYSYDMAGQVVDSVAVGVSPEALAVDYNLPATATAEAEPSRSISTFPQPFCHHLSIDLRSVPSPADRVEILDLTGRVLVSERVNGRPVITMETSSIAAGAYLARVHSNGQAWTCKLVKVAE
jgi:hypothetical protein